MPEYQHQRHKPGTPLASGYTRDLVVACMPMRSNVNISAIARTAGACAVGRLVVCGNASLISKIARDESSELEVATHRTLAPVLCKLRDDGYRLVGLEQTTNSTNMHTYKFARRSVLVVGNERTGLSQEILDLLDDVVEIPVYGLPHSYNAATATSMALYEYCRQFPDG